MVEQECWPGQAKPATTCDLNCFIDLGQPGKPRSTDPRRCVTAPDCGIVWTGRDGRSDLARVRLTALRVESVLQVAPHYVVNRVTGGDDGPVAHRQADKREGVIT